MKIETALLLCVSFLSSEGPFDSFEEWGQVFILDAPSQRLGMDSGRLCEENLQTQQWMRLKVWCGGELLKTGWTEVKKPYKRQAKQPVRSIFLRRWLPTIHRTQRWQKPSWKEVRVITMPRFVHRVIEKRLCTWREDRCHRSTHSWQQCRHRLSSGDFWLVAQMPLHAFRDAATKVLLSAACLQSCSCSPLTAG